MTLEDQQVDDLTEWLAELPGRLARGELAGRGRFRLGNGVVFPDIEAAARLMLTDWDRHSRLAPELGDRPRTVAGRRALLDAFRRLREQIG